MQIRNKKENPRILDYNYLGIQQTKTKNSNQDMKKQVDKVIWKHEKSNVTIGLD